MERLQKAIAQAGICSRRKAEELIQAGKVKVNGEVVTQPGMKVSGADEITVSGKRLEKEEKAYYLLNKPKGCISAVHDPRGRRSVVDYIDDDRRLFPVGRLDYDTSGALILTNDGEFANLLTHPRYHLPKVYRINLQGILSDEDIRDLRKGLQKGHEKYQPAKVFVKSRDYTRERTQLELTIQEGKYHQVKNMMEALGHEVRRLHRTSFAGLSADDMKPGEYRRLKPYEVKELIRQAQEENT